MDEPKKMDDKPVASELALGGGCCLAARGGALPETQWAPLLLLRASE